MDAVSLWPVFAEHLSLLCRYGRDPRRHSEPSWWGVLSGEEHADLNQGGLTGLATEVTPRRSFGSSMRPRFRL